VISRFASISIAFLAVTSMLRADAGSDQYYELQNIKPPENCALKSVEWHSTLTMPSCFPLAAGKSGLQKQ